jgi:hypothetical protein
MMNYKKKMSGIHAADCILDLFDSTSDVRHHQSESMVTPRSGPACGGGALPFERASLNVPDAFSWNSRLDWSTFIA